MFPTPRVLLFFLTFTTTAVTFSLEQGRDAEREAVQSISYDAVNLFSTSLERSRVDITYRVPKQFFVYVRNVRFRAGTTSEAEFIARTDILVEIFNMRGVSVARELVHKRIGTDRSDTPLTRRGFLQGIFSFDLPPAEYRIVFEVDDLESTRKFRETTRRVILRDFRKHPLELSDPLFIEPLDGAAEAPRRFTPVNLGGNVFFGRNFDGYVQIIRNQADTQNVKLSYDLYRLGESRRDTSYFVRDSVLLRSDEASLSLEIERQDTAYFYRIEHTETPNKFAAFLSLRGAQLPEGEYELRLLASDGVHSRRYVHRFRVLWIDMPRSLRDLDFAIDALEHIATREELSHIRSAFQRARRERFQDFWKAKDPTPGSAFNEAKAEYYHRVDYAIENFSSLRQPDGHKTDRGKVYIIYGPPTDIERVFSPVAAPREIWTYNTIAKRFIFVDEVRNGTYKLAVTEELQ